MAEAQAACFYEHAANKRASSHHQSFFSEADIDSIAGHLNSSAGSSLAAAVPRRRGAGGAKKKPSAATSVMQELAVPKHFSKKVLKTMDLDTSIDGTRVVVRWQPLNDSVGPRKVPVLAIEHVPAVIEQQLELLGTVGPAHLFYHMRHHMPFHMAPGPDGKPRVIRGACGFTEESIELYMAGDPFYADTKPTLASQLPPPNPLDGFYAPFHHCQADLLRLGEDENDTQARPEKFLYVLMYVCLFTRRVWLRALRSKSAIGVAREIYFIWMDTMVPGKLQTDNGSEFANAILNELCDKFGVQFIHGSVGHPQSQGCCERSNRELRDTARTELMRAPTTCWPEQIMRVQDMINNRPCSVFSNKKTRNFVLYGTLPHTSKRPSIEDVNEVLQFESTAEAVLPNAAAHSPAAAGRPGARTTGGKKRPAAAAADLPELSDEEEQQDWNGESADELEAAEWHAAVGTRHSRRQAAGGRLAEILAAEAEPLGGGEEEPPARAMPQRAAAISSAAGKRRRVSGLLQGALAQHAAPAASGSAAVPEGPVKPGPSNAAGAAAAQRSRSAGPSSIAEAATAGPSIAAGAAANMAVGPSEMVAVSMLEQLRREPMPTRRSSRQQAAAAGKEGVNGQGSMATEPAVLEPLAAGRAAAAEEAGPSSAAAEEAGPSSAAADLELPAHLADLRQQVLKDHEKNRARIAAQHRGKAKAPEYNVGDAVLLTLPKWGTVGGDPVQAPKKPVAIVTGVRKPFGKRAYQVRTNAGVLSKAVEPRQLQPAPPRSAAMLQFDGVETQGVPKISVHAARGKAAHRCRCRGPKCGPKCACKKARRKCSRNCTCKHGKGGRCGNCP